MQYFPFDEDGSYGDHVAFLDRIGSEALAIGDDLVACARVPEDIPPGLLEVYAERLSDLSDRLNVVIAEAL